MCCTYNKARLISVMQCSYGVGSSSILQKCVLHVLIIIIIIIIITNDGWLGGGEFTIHTHRERERKFVRLTQREREREREIEEKEKEIE